MKKTRLITVAIVTLFSFSSFAYAGEGQGKHNGKNMERMKAADVNNDHRISKDEFINAISSNFSKMDKNGDGFLDKKDRKGNGNQKGGGMSDYKKMDTNGDGNISQAEFEASKSFKKNMRR